VKSMIPTALRVVALLHLLGGVLTVAAILVKLTHGRISLDFGVLGIPIYFGLMRFSRGWRTCALVFIWLGILLAPVAFILGLTTHFPAYFQIFGVRLASIRPVWLSVASVFWFLLELWQYRVLTRADIRSLFLQPAPGLAA
jgi:hypothetical protein